MKLANIFLATTVIITSGLPAIADESTIARCPTGPHGPRMGDCHKFSRLDLTDEQNEKLYQLKEKFADQIGLTKVEIKKERRKMRDLLTQATIDRKAVEAAQSKINTLKTDLSNQKLSFKLDVSEILTAEQRKQLRYGSFGSSWGKEARVGEAQGKSTLIGLLPDLDIDLDSDTN
jgi:Spy/CpxP family protein refolding chaperone